MSEPTHEQLRAQIRRAVREYSRNANVDVKSAMLSGMALVASFLAKLDGSQSITPAAVLKAVADVAEKEGYDIGRLRDGT